MKLIGFFALILTALSFSRALHAQTVEVMIDGEACSGFIGKLSMRSQKAYVFTAGHCLPGILDAHFPKKIVVQTPIVPTKKFLVRNLKEASQISSVEVSQIVFASFDKYDVAVLDVVESVRELEARGVSPILIEVGLVHLNTKIEIVNPLRLETKSCSVENHVPKLTYQFWSWLQVSRLSKECELTHGWSGAVVFNRQTGSAVGIVSGGNESGSCDDYCEVGTNDEKLAIKDRSYFNRLTFLAPCTDRNGIFNPMSCTTL